MIKELAAEQKAVATYLEIKSKRFAQQAQEAQLEFKNYVMQCASSLSIDLAENWSYINGHFEKVEEDAIHQRKNNS